MTEGVGQAVRAERLARRRIDVESRSTGRHRGDGSIVRLTNRRVDVARPLVGFADGNGSREVDAV